MPSNTYPLIAREGWPVLVILLGAVVASYFYTGVTTSVISITLFLIALFLLRDPEQLIPSLPLAIVSPVYARVISTEIQDDPWLIRRGLRIRLQVSWLDIYSLRSPIEGKIMNQWSRRDESSNTLRKFAFWVKSDENDDIVVVIYLNRLTAFFFRFYIHSGERIGHGQRCGFLCFGGMVDVFIPENSKILVDPGMHISSGSSVVAELVHQSSASAMADEGEQAIEDKRASL